MVYLITHIAIWLVVAQLLGLLLGWLLWGYAARQRSGEVQGLRARISDLQARADLPAMTARPALAAEQRASLPLARELFPEAVLQAAPETTREVKPLVEDDLAETPALPRLIFQADSTLPPPVPDLKAEVQEARLQHYEKQIRELESFRDRLPQVQTELAAALSARQLLEKRLADETTSFETRIDDLSKQIRQFEEAAFEWDRSRDEWERDQAVREKELAAVKAHLRDVQNNQLPQKADASGAPAVSPLEHADLRERYQKALLERDALAVQLEAARHAAEDQTGGHSLTSRITELEAALRAKEANLADQASQVETLLWRVAELEPLAATLPDLEENLNRQEAEISGHVAMHTESADHIRNLLNRVAELEAETLKITQIEAAMARLKQEHGTELDARETRLQKLSASYQVLQVDLQKTEERAVEAERTAGARWADLEQLRAAHDRQVVELSALRTEAEEAALRMVELSAQTEKIPQLEASLASATVEVEHLRTESEAAQRRIAELAVLKQKTAQLEDSLSVRAAELASVHEKYSDATRRIEQLVPLAEKLPESEALLTASIADVERLGILLSQHEAELQKSSTARTRLEEQIKDLENRLTELEPQAAQVPDLLRLIDLRDDERKKLTQLLAGREEDIRAVLVSREQLQLQLDSLQRRVQDLTQSQLDLQTELQRAQEENYRQTQEASLLLDQLSHVSGQLVEANLRLRQVEPLAAQASENEQKLLASQAQHNDERVRLQAHSALRLRRLRQSITTFKG